MRKKCKNLNKLLILVVLFAVIFSLNVSFVEAADCEDAFIRCVDDPLSHIYMGGEIICIVGYVFCKKYIERG